MHSGVDFSGLKRAHIGILTRSIWLTLKEFMNVKKMLLMGTTLAFLTAGAGVDAVPWSERDGHQRGEDHPHPVHGERFQLEGAVAG